MINIAAAEILESAATVIRLEGDYGVGKNYPQCMLSLAHGALFKYHINKRYYVAVDAFADHIDDSPTDWAERHTADEVADAMDRAASNLRGKQ